MFLRLPISLMLLLLTRQMFFFCPLCSDFFGIKSLECRDLLTKYDAKFKHYEKDSECRTHFNRKDHLRPLYEYEIGEFKTTETAQKGMIYCGCNCGNCHLIIPPTGEVYAWRRVDGSNVGIIHKVLLGPMEKFREYTKFSKCSKCELLLYCRKCTAVENETCGNCYTEDPQCLRIIKEDLRD